MIVHSKFPQGENTDFWCEAKRIPPGTGSKAALRDPILELDISGKQLGDDELAQLLPTLEDCIRHQGESGPILILEDLCLKHNKLTVASLRHLMRLLALVSQDLRDLDLSDNQITIQTQEDRQIWQDFLETLSAFCVLRRLDLSGNALGTKAFELLERVYAHEQDFYPSTRGQQTTSSQVSLSTIYSEREGIASLTESTQVFAITTQESEYQADMESEYAPSASKGKATRQGLMPVL